MSKKPVQIILIALVALAMCVAIVIIALPEQVASIPDWFETLDWFHKPEETVLESDTTDEETETEAGMALSQQAKDRDQVMAVLDNEFLSRTKVTYDNINGNTVDVFTFYRGVGESQNNPNFSQILLVKQCIDYKKAHPEEEVKITIASFHFSVVLAACLDEDSPEYGHLKNLYDQEYDEETGYYRLAYLLGEAAKMGIEVTALAHLHANPVKVDAHNSRSDIMFEDYYYPLLEEPAYIEGKTVGDFMTARKFEWTSYGDQAATDMMHLKLCAVSHYIDRYGVERRNAVWMGCINIDGVDYEGHNGNDSIQTALLITGHDELYRISYNYGQLIADYYRQQDSTIFRDLASRMATEQIQLLGAGRGHEIPLDQQIVYIGTEMDPVFELYFTPFGGEVNNWDTVNNPYCKYLYNLLPHVSGEDAIEVLWNNVKYSHNNDLLDTFIEIIAYAFEENPRTDNQLHLYLPGLDESVFEGLEPGVNIGSLWINQRSIGYHNKDLQLSYVINGERHYVTLYNSLNMHEGSMCYQANTVLVIHETAETGNHLYVDYAVMTAP